MPVFGPFRRFFDFFHFCTDQRYRTLVANGFWLINSVSSILAILSALTTMAAQPVDRSQAAYNQRLQDSVQLLNRNFRGLLSAAQVDIKTGSSAAADHDRERLQIDLNTANIVKAGEELLRLVDELKLPVIANDFEL